MKRLTLVLLVLCLAGASAGAQGGILGRIGREARRSTERAVGRAVDNAVNKAVDKAVDQAVEKAAEKAVENAAKDSGVEVEVDRGAVKDAPAKEQQAARQQPAAEGTWNCPACGATGNTGRYCDDCRAKNPALKDEPDEVEEFKPGLHSTWFCNDVGTTLSYEQTDGEGKSTNSFQYVIKDRSRKGGKTEITYDMIVPILSGPVEGCVWAADGWFHADAASSMGQVGKDLKVSGHAPVIPDSPVIDARLKDCTVKIESMGTVSDYSDVRFTRHEKITTPAGTFDGWCLEYTNTTKMAFIKTVTTTEQWMAKDVGVVRTVVKDRKGKVQSTTELVKIEK
ncbi:MAG: hypothetical protein J5640_03615 [Bacteroidales bacterium]|nr:hypothetical protein [Bacteroidales bacterium]